MRTLVRVSGILTLALVMSTVWFYQRWQANGRAVDAVLKGGPSEDLKLGKIQQDLLDQYGRESQSAQDTYTNLSFALLGIGALQLMLTFLFRKHPGASMLDFGLVSIVGTILIGIAHDLRVDAYVVLGGAGLVLILVVARRLRARPA